MPRLQARACRACMNGGTCPGIGFNSNILQLSNFNGKALALPGQFRGMGPVRNVRYGRQREGVDDERRADRRTLHPGRCVERAGLPVLGLGRADAVCPRGDARLSLRETHGGVARCGRRRIHARQSADHHRRRSTTIPIGCTPRFTATTSSRSTVVSNAQTTRRRTRAASPSRSLRPTRTIACSPTSFCQRTRGRRIRPSWSWAAPRSWTR